MAVRFTAKQLAELPPTKPTDWIVEGLLRTGRNRPSLLCGFPGSGKSTLAHQLAIAVATGDSFLGRDTSQGRVAYWKNEDSAHDVREDFFRAGMTEDDPVSIILPEPSDNNFEILAADLQCHPDTRLVIVETLADFLLIPDSNNNDDCRKGLQRFSDVIMKPNPNSAFLLLHHFNKSNLDAELSSVKIQGGTAIAACTDGKIYLSQVSDADQRRVVQAQVRKGLPIEPTYLVFDERTLTATLGETLRSETINSRNAEKQEKKLDLENRIVRVVRDNPGLSKWDVVSKVGGKKQTVGKTIDELIQADFIASVVGGEKGNARCLYWKPDQSPEWLAAVESGKQHSRTTSVPEAPDTRPAIEKVETRHIDALATGETSAHDGVR